MSSVLFFAVLHSAYRYAGLLERHLATMLQRSLCAGAPIRALLDQDDEQQVGTTADGSLVIHVDGAGLRCELPAIPDTGPGRRLARALEAGSITGCSFPATPRRVRWHVGPHPLRELLDADAHEVSILPADSS